VERVIIKYLTKIRLCCTNLSEELRMQ
jgi:hypothetical protein